MRSASSAGPRGASEPVSRFTPLSITCAGVCGRCAPARSNVWWLTQDVRRCAAAVASGPMQQDPALASAPGRQHHELDVVAERAAQRVFVAGGLEHAAGFVGSGRGAAAGGQLEYNAHAVEPPGALERGVVDGALAAGLDAQAKLTAAGRDEADLGLVARRAGLLPLAAEAHQPLVGDRKSTRLN